MTITRAPGNPGRSKNVEFNSVVQLVATAADRSADLKGQEAQTLSTIDALLTEAGSDKSRPLNATVYILGRGHTSSTWHVQGARPPSSIP